jgi:hypothetical protein
MSEQPWMHIAKAAQCESVHFVVQQVLPGGSSSHPMQL